MKKALLIGINKYSISNADLKGCVNDVTNIRDILLRFFGFPVKDIRVLVDERATKKAIIKRLHWLVKGAKKDDQLLFHFSGHGSQVRDRDGDELKDHLDEILCPHDMDWDDTFITDDDLSKLFSNLPKGVNLEVLLDCCHSGTGTRELSAIQNLPREFSMSPRFLAAPLDIQSRNDDDDIAISRVFRKRNPMNHVLFAGCKENQTSADAFIKGSYNGAFTYFLCKHLRKTQGDIDRTDLLKRVRASIRYEGFSQTPQLECPKSERKKMLLE